MERNHSIVTKHREIGEEKEKKRRIGSFCDRKHQFVSRFSAHLLLPPSLILLKSWQ